LINNWDNNTFQDSIDNGSAPGFKGAIDDKNYIFRVVNKFEDAKTNPAKRQVF
jgi:hypothetical protein